MRLSKFQNLKRPIELISILGVCDESLAKILHSEESRRDKKKKCAAYVLTRKRKQFSVIGRNPNVFRSRNNVLKKIFDLDEDLFTRHYRLCRETFYKSLNS